MKKFEELPEDLKINVSINPVPGSTSNLELETKVLKDKLTAMFKKSKLIPDLKDCIWLEGPVSKIAIIKEIIYHINGVTGEVPGFLVTADLIN